MGKCRCICGYGNWLEYEWGIKARFEQGTSGYQHFTCYGYRFDETEQTLVIVPAEVAAVRMIFELRLRGIFTRTTMRDCGVADFKSVQEI